VTPVLGGSEVGLPGRASGGGTAASLLIGGAFDEVGVPIREDDSLPGGCPEYEPGTIEPPGPYAGVGKSSHSEQWKIDQWA
jgi:hypothetical protein